MRICRKCRGVPRLSYLAWHEDAEGRMRRGQKSRKCPNCGLYEWLKEFAVGGAEGDE